MSDFCVSCGNVEAGKNAGEYIEFTNLTHNISIERFVCYYCMVGDSNNE